MSGRDAKWEPIAPGETIPAGQPYMKEYDGHAGGIRRAEFQHQTDVRVGYFMQHTQQWVVGNRITGWFVDSTWYPPLDLPTHPLDSVRGIARWVDRDRWTYVAGFHNKETGMAFARPIRLLADFIQLTDEQLSQMERRQ